LFVDALNGAPGVLSARYAGEPANNIANIEKLLRLLGDNDQRKARFRTIIALIIDGKSMQFEGICEGKIIHAPKGEKGFGYDAIFVPDGSDSTFAEMEMEQKNKFSHRKKAVAQLIAFLNRAQ
jgi:XTP/dITP diphosphohydrolase